MAGEILGRIDCPVCGTVEGVRITHDKNGKPFGFCDADCNTQIRIGGNENRVKKFIARYPWAASKVSPPVTDTVKEVKQEKTPAPAAEKKEIPKWYDLANGAQ